MLSASHTSISSTFGSNKHQEKGGKNYARTKTRFTEVRIRRVNDMVSLMQSITKAREAIARKSYSMSSEDLKKKSHLIVTVMIKDGDDTEPVELSFIELCGSEQAASLKQIGKQSKQSVSVKEFASTTFNSLSMEVISGKPISSPLVKGAKNLCFICSVSPSPSQFKHSLTAIKFAHKL